MLRILSLSFALICLPFTTVAWGQSSDLTPELKTVADDELYQPHIGLGAALSSPEGAFNPGGQYTLEFGLQPIIPLSYTVKAGYGYYTDGPANFSRTSLILEGKYNFGGTIPVIRHTYVGLGLGPAWEDTTLDEGLALIVYPQAGFDIPLKAWIGEPVSAGLNLNYMVSTRNTPDTTNLAAVVKYWY